MSTPTRAAVAALAAAALAAGCAAPEPEPEEPAPSSPAATEPPTEAAPDDAPAGLEEIWEMWDGLEVKGRAPKTGYDRDEFGQRWRDLDHNGCDQRNDVLARDLEDPVAPDGCRVESGALEDPYTAQTIEFQRGEDTSRAVQIDHVVALSDAWQKGAATWSAEKREQFANDPGNLLAVDGPANQQKGDGDTATWLPPNKEFRCEYVVMQVSVKDAYELWVTGAEKEAMGRELSGCDKAPELKDEPQSVPEPEEANGPKEQRNDDAPAGGEPAGDGAGFSDCRSAWEAGAAPIRRGEPGYAPSLDGDGDGVACENPPS